MGLLLSYEHWQIIKEKNFLYTGTTSCGFRLGAQVSKEFMNLQTERIRESQARLDQEQLAMHRSMAHDGLEAVNPIELRREPRRRRVRFPFVRPLL